MKNRNRYLVYLFYFLLTIPTVILIFKFIEPKKMASVFAAGLFISCSLLVFWGELRQKSYRGFTLWTAVAFLLLFSGPMIAMRLLQYDLDFSDIKVGYLSGPEFHKLSNYGFIALIAATLIDYVRTRK